MIQQAVQILSELLLWSAGVYLFLCGWMFLFQHRMVFMPRRGIDGTPAAVGLEFEEVWLPLLVHGQVQAWWVPGKTATAPVILFCHGNAGNLADRLPTLRLFHDLGAATLIFDYPGYGNSPGRPTEAGCHAAALAAWVWLTEIRRVVPNRIVILGRSLGGAVAAWLAGERPIAALVIESAFTSVPDLGAALYPWLPVRLLCRFRFSTREYLGQVQCPVTVIHSKMDEMIPFAHAEKLYAAAPEPKSLVVIEGDHNDGYLVSGDAYAAALSTMLRKCQAPLTEWHHASTFDPTATRNPT